MTRTMYQSDVVLVMTKLKKLDPNGALPLESIQRRLVPPRWDSAFPTQFDENQGGRLGHFLEI